MTLAEILGSNSRDKDAMKSDLSPAQGDVASVIFFLSEFIKFKLKDKRLKMYSRTIEDSMIWGHPTPLNGQWGTAKWGGRHGSNVLIYDSGDL